MSTATLKQSRLNIRCDSRTRELLDRAAGYVHLSVSEFVLSHAQVCGAVGSPATPVATV